VDQTVSPLEKTYGNCRRFAYFYILDKLLQFETMATERWQSSKITPSRGFFTPSKFRQGTGQTTEWINNFCLRFQPVMHFWRRASQRTRTLGV